jgi:DNA-binding response OmpR family regulator
MVRKRPLTAKKILIVDDEPDVLETLAEILSMCRVTKASTFEEAKAYLNSKKYDAAILDIMGVNGYKLLELAESRQIPAVMLTAHAFSVEDTVKSFKDGAALYIPKDKMANIAELLLDMFEALKKGKKPWHRWFEKFHLYYDRKFGPDWKNKDKEFWEKFRYYSSGF